MLNCNNAGLLEHGGKHRDIQSFCPLYVRQERTRILYCRHKAHTQRRVQSENGIQVGEMEIVLVTK